MTTNGLSMKHSLPTLETQRLKIRPITFEDAPSIFAYAKNPNVSRFTLWEPHQSLKDSETFIKEYVFPNYLNLIPEPFAVTFKENITHVIGTVGCFWVDKSSHSMELAYSYGEEYWGKGIACEAGKAILKYCFENLNAIRIQARCKKENTASAKVMQKLGMRFEGTLRSSLFHRGKHWDMEYYSILKSEFSKI